MSLLEVRDLHVAHGKVEAVHGVSLAIDAGRIVTVIGPNGAGKTTLLGAIMGLLPSRGEIRYGGESLAGLAVEERVAQKLCLVPERRELFAAMSVADNLELGAFARHRAGDRTIGQTREEVYRRFPRLAERRQQFAGTLSGGERQMLALGRALMAKPALLMLDEPSLDQATQLLLAPAALEFHQLSRVLADIHGHRIDYADLYFQYSRVEAWSLEEGIVKSGSFSIDRGVGVRAVTGERTAFAYSDDISLEALAQAASATRAIAQQGQSAVAALERVGNARSLYAARDPVMALTDGAKVGLLERLERLARARDPRVTQVTASLAGEYEAILVARSDGLIAADVRPLVRLSLNVIVEDNGRREQGMAGGGGRLDYSYFTEALLQDYAAQAVDQALLNVSARAAP